jgi:hypothetical protein
VILPDVNVLLYAFRSDSTDHDRYLEWLGGVVNGPAAFGMSPQVLASLVRIATHPRIYARPSSLEDAFAFTRVLVEQPNCRIVEPGDQHWEIFERLCRDARATGNLVQDAWLAALAIESGCEWISTDRDARRFEEIQRAPDLDGKAVAGPRTWPATRPCAARSWSCRTIRERAVGDLSRE